MKKIVSVITICLLFSCAFAQDDKTISIIVSGQGKTNEEAKQVALRNAIEQAFGTFISSNTKILNDALIKDEIISLSNGNIQKFDILNSSTLPDGSAAITLNAIVSVSKLISFSEAKGVTIEFKGGLFAINVKQQILNEQAETKAILDMLFMLNPVLHQSIDYSISNKDPQSLDNENKKWAIPLIVEAKSNKNIEFLFDYLKKNLALVALKPEEVDSYTSLNKKVYPILVDSITFNFRTWESRRAIIYFFAEINVACQNFIVTNNFSKRKVYEFEYKRNSIETKKIYTAMDSRECSDIELDLNPITARPHGYIPKIKSTIAGKVLTIYTFQDILSLGTLENLNGYSVAPNYPNSKIGTWYEGGVVFSENSDGSGLVWSLWDLSKIYQPSKPNSVLVWKVPYDTAFNMCSKYSFYGYNDWTLPSCDELILVYKNIEPIISSVGFREQYWGIDGIVGGYNRSEGKGNCMPYYGKGYPLYVRAVRKFK